MAEAKADNCWEIKTWPRFEEPEYQLLVFKCLNLS